MKKMEKTYKELVDELKFWGGLILSRLSYPEDDLLYSSIEYACMYPEEIGIDSVELTVIANSQVEDGEMENMIEEFYSILLKIAEENEVMKMNRNIRKQNRNRYMAIEESKNFYIFMDRKNREYIAVKKE